MIVKVKWKMVINLITEVENRGSNVKGGNIYCLNMSERSMRSLAEVPEELLF